MNCSDSSPIMSVIVIGYKMARQLAKTLYSLSAAYQRDVSPTDYEVVVVENPSEDLMGPEALEHLEGNFRYFCMKENHPSPVYAINFAFKQCKGEFIGLLIDGAHMVTPGVLKHAMIAYRATPEAYVLTPAYHLGHEEQNLSVTKGYNETVEQQLLTSINWPENGYRLFEIGVFSAANRFGYLQPFMECNCLFASLDSFAHIGFADTRFQYPGGGALLLHMMRKLGLRLSSHLFVLAGEGSFHQFHGGVTSNSSREKNATIFKKQLQDIWNQQFHGLRRKAILLGTIEHEAFPMLVESAEKGMQRLERLTHQGISHWADDNPSQHS